MVFRINGATLVRYEASRQIGDTTPVECPSPHGRAGRRSGRKGASSARDRGWSSGSMARPWCDMRPAVRSETQRRSNALPLTGELVGDQVVKVPLRLAIGDGLQDQWRDPGAI